MAITNSIENFKMTVNEKFVEKAESLIPELLDIPVEPVRLVEIFPAYEDFSAKEKNKISELENISLGAGEKICFDFGDHQVGYISFKINSVGSPPDAPAYLHLKFGEIPYEIAADSANYHGSIAKGWIQEEFIHVDVIPSTIRLPRRYAFRYFQIEVIDTSPKYKIFLSDVICNSVSSADMKKISPLKISDAELLKMDKVSLKTMQDCMQLVFEDGPKRDRRLWIGDLRLQALTNYETFKNNDLVKR